jgi:hypothetical protein
MSRSTVATVVGDAITSIYITPDGGSGLLMSQIRYYSNVLGFRETIQNSVGENLFPGDKISIETSDNSTAGAIYYMIYVSIDEYDE